MSTKLQPGPAETLGQRIQRLRLQRGLSQGKLALEVGAFSVRSLQGWEADRREPDFRLGLILAKALGVHPDELVEGTAPLAKRHQKTVEEEVEPPKKRGRPRKK